MHIIPMIPSPSRAGYFKSNATVIQLIYLKCSFMPCRILVHSSKVNAKGHGSKAFVFALTPRTFFTLCTLPDLSLSHSRCHAMQLILKSSAEKQKISLGVDRTETKLNGLEMKMFDGAGADGTDESERVTNVPSWSKICKSLQAFLEGN